MTQATHAFPARWTLRRTGEIDTIMAAQSPYRQGRVPGHFQGYPRPLFVPACHLASLGQACHQGAPLPGRATEPQPPTRSSPESATMVALIAISVAWP